MTASLWFLALTSDPSKFRSSVLAGRRKLTVKPSPHRAGKVVRIKKAIFGQIFELLQGSFSSYLL